MNHTPEQDGFSKEPRGVHFESHTPTDSGGGESVNFIGKIGENTPTPRPHPDHTPVASTPQHPSPIYRGGCAGVRLDVGSIPSKNLMPTLPALRCLGNLNDVRPVIVIDTREQTPLTFDRLASAPGTLTTGDYSFHGGEEVFAVERKTIPDLVACCMGVNRDRFFRELHRLRGYRFKRLLVVGTRAEIESGTYRSNIAPASILSTLRAIEVRFDVPGGVCRYARRSGQGN